MDSIREQARDLSEVCYLDFLQEMIFEIESEIELYNWRSTESDEE